MFIAGMAVPVMAGMNAGFGLKLQSPMGAVAVLCFAAFCFALAVLVFSQKPNWAGAAEIPKAFYLGGGLFVFYIASITLAAPRIGLGNAIFLVLLGQIVSAVLIDHFGLFGMTETKVSVSRVGGIVLMVAGIYLARRGA